MDFELGPRLAGVKIAGTKCILWPGATRNGYGVKKVGSTTTPAHKFVYENVTGKKVPKGMAIDHLCRNRLCINPKHLEPVSSSDNKSRAWAFKLGHYKHKYYKGEQVSKSLDDRREAMVLEGILRDAIAEKATARRRETAVKPVWADMLP